MLRLKSIDELKGKHVRDSAMRESGLHMGGSVSGAVRGEMGVVSASGSAPGVPDGRGKAAREGGNGEAEGGHRKIVARGAARESGMNGTEAEYAGKLESRRRAGEIIEYHYEAVTLKLADNTRYTPDFLVMTADGELEIHEVKGGFIREDGWQKLKIAAGMFPFRFFLCQKLAKKDGGNWKIKEV